MTEFYNLSKTLKIFSEGLDLDYAQRFDWLNDDVTSGFIDKILLKEELDAAFNNKNFDWQPLSLETDFIRIPPRKSFENDDIKIYVKVLIWRYLYPECIDEAVLQSLKGDIKRYLQGDGASEWVPCLEVWLALKVDERYMNLDILSFYLAIIDTSFTRRHKSDCYFLPGFLKRI